MESKICPKCSKDKPMSHFYKDKSRANGHRSACKECYVSLYKKSESGKQVQIDYYVRTEIETKRKYRKTAKHKKYVQGRRNREYSKVRAKECVKEAVKAGKLTPVKECICSACCISTADEYHHPNGYTLEHRLDVVPLCKPCHIRVHGKTPRTVGG
jgi:hypothetical protein